MINILGYVLTVKKHNKQRESRMRLCAFYISLFYYYYYKIRPPDSVNYIFVLYYVRNRRFNRRTLFRVLWPKMAAAGATSILRNCRGATGKREHAIWGEMGENIDFKFLYCCAQAMITHASLLIPAY